MWGMMTDLLRRGPLAWAEPSWLEAHLDTVRVIDSQPHLHDYLKGHIPGAVFCEEIPLRVSYAGLPGQFVSEEMASLLFSRLGISNDTPVAVYSGKGKVKGWGDGISQFLWAYALLRFGHGNVIILDGGLERWEEEGHETTQDLPHISPSSYLAEARPDMMADLDRVKGALRDRDRMVIDTRAPAVYSGQAAWAAPGHIPGAVSIHWRSLMREGKLNWMRPFPEIEAVFAEKGVLDRRDLIVTCGTGREAACEYLILKYLMGRDVRLHEGSFTEWVAAGLPTAGGDDPGVY
jgi:thiosulfate/3-mercaptopyruvate sulfurtransferase